jgi:PilZ domain
MKRRPSALNYQVDLVGVLTREVATRLIEISRSGCLLESRQRIEEGTVATLRLEVAGQVYTEEVRATRCVAVAGSGSSYLIGIEFLKTGPAHEMSIRRALAGSLGSIGDSLPGSWGAVSL